MRSGYLKSKKCDLILYVSTEITVLFFIKKNINFLKAALLFLDKLVKKLLLIQIRTFLDLNFFPDCLIKHLDI